MAIRLPHAPKHNIYTEEAEMHLLQTIAGAQYTPQQIKDFITLLRQNSPPGMPNKRTLKLVERTRYNARDVQVYSPELILKGDWLHHAGFHCNDYAQVLVMNKLLIVTHG